MSSASRRRKSERRNARYIQALEEQKRVGKAGVARTIVRGRKLPSLYNKLVKWGLHL